MRFRSAQIRDMVKSHALDLLFRSACRACGDELPDSHGGVNLCTDCLSQIPLVDWPVCRRCAAEVPVYPGKVATCPRCESDKLRFDAAFSIGHYEGLLREFILQMKVDRREQWGQIFAQLILDRLGDTLRRINLDAIVPVPMNPWHRLFRGSNAPTVIARAVGRSLGIPVWSRLLSRNFELIPQRGLSRAGRFRNVRGGYRVRRGYFLDSPHILIVDDVLTTGATCSEVARVLKHAGALRVSVLVVARTPNS